MDAHQNEVFRLRALQQYNILDSPREPAFDGIVGVAATALNMPVAAISLLDQDRQWFKAIYGASITHTPRTGGLCYRAIDHANVTIVSDIHADAQYTDPDFIAFDRSLRFYAAAPIIVPGGACIGTLCVLDRKLRPDFGAREIAVLEGLAGLVITQLALRQTQMAHEQAINEIGLMRDISNLLADTSPLEVVLDTAMGKIARAMQGAFCEIWERDSAENAGLLIAMKSSDAEREARYAPLNGHAVTRLSLPTAQVLFNDAPGHLVHLLTADDDGHARRRLGRSLGLKSLIGCSLQAHGSRYVVIVAYDTERADLEECAAKLDRLSATLEPVLHRKLHDKRVELLSSALEATHDGVCLAAISSLGADRLTIEFVNAAFTAQTGYDAAQIVGKTTSDIFSFPEGEGTERERMQTAMAKRLPARGETLMRRSDGTTFWAEFTLVPLKDGNGETTHFVTIQRDVSERRDAAEAGLKREQEMQATAERLRQITDRLTRTQRIAKLGSWRREVGQDAMEWTDEVYPMFGVTPETFTPGVEACWALIHPDDRQLIIERMAAVDRTGIGYQVEYRTLGADGVLRHVWTDCVAERDEHGKAIALNGFIQDITARKQSEDMLLRAEKLRSIGQLTGGVAHDFNNLLTVISVNLEMLGEDMEPGSEPDQLRCMALRAADSGAQLTTSLLSFARRQPLQPKPLDLAKLLTEFQEMARHSMGERHPVVLEIAPNLPPCLIDRAGFEGAILNLLVNSRDAMPDGGVVTVWASQRCFKEAVKNIGTGLGAGTYVVISVTDTGTGIPAELQEKVFEPFFTTKPVGKGSGLGLSSVIGFVRQSGGEVELQSTPGMGTSVRMYLPAVEPVIFA